MTQSNDKRPLTELQQRILDIIWSRGPLTSDQVREALLPDSPLKDSSIRTLLRRLEHRGLISHETAGKTFVYRASMAPHSAAAGLVRQMIDRFWAGSAEQFLLGMVDEEILGPAEIQRLAKKIGDRPTSRKPSTPGKKRSS